MGNMAGTSGKVVIENVVMVSGYPDNVDASRIVELFQECGKVSRFLRKPDHVLLEFENSDQAEIALEEGVEMYYGKHKLLVQTPSEDALHNLREFNKEQEVMAGMEQMMDNLSVSQRQKLLQKYMGDGSGPSGSGTTLTPMTPSKEKKSLAKDHLPFPPFTPYQQGAMGGMPPPGGPYVPSPGGSFSGYYPSGHKYPEIKLPIFSGDSKAKDHASFQRWSYEVKCLVNAQHPEEAILQAIRRSLKGIPADALFWLGEQAKVADILNKLEGLYGIVSTGESLIQKFYAEQMKPNETVTEWGCRLEDIISQAVAKGKVERSAADGMLRNKFWADLADERLKNATRHKFDHISSFHQLLVEVRTIEQEIDDKEKRQQPPSKTVKATHMAAQSSKNDDLVDMIKKLSEQMNQLNKRMSGLENEKTSSKPVHTSSTPSTEVKDGRDDEVCYRCGHSGHIRKGCRMKPEDFLVKSTDGKSKPLN